MTDRLNEIKAALERLKIAPHHYDAARPYEVSMVQDLYWCVKEIERLAPFRNLVEIT